MCPFIRLKRVFSFVILCVCVCVQTLALSYIAGTLSAMYTVSSVLVCILITVGVCVCVSIAAITCPCDITKCQAVFALLGILLMIFGIAVMITYFVAGYNQVLGHYDQGAKNRIVFVLHKLVLVNKCNALFFIINIVYHLFYRRCMPSMEVLLQWFSSW